MNGKIYMIRNEVNGKRYIGQTVNSLEERFKQHKQGTRQPKKNMTKLQKAMDKYGKPMFTITLIEDHIETIELLAEREKFFIEKFNTKEEYNSTSGGENRLRTKTTGISEGRAFRLNSFLLNEVRFNYFTKKEIDFTYGLLHLLQERDYSITKLPLDKTFDTLGFNTVDKTKLKLDPWVENLRKKIVTYKINNEEIETKLFVFLKLDFDQRVIFFRINDNIKNVLIERKARSISFNYFDFLKLNKKYSKLLFRLLSQWARNGECTYELNEFKRLMDMPKYLDKTSKIKQVVIMPAITELETMFPGLTYIPILEKQKLVKCKFVWDKQKILEKQMSEISEKRKPKSRTKNEEKRDPEVNSVNTKFKKGAYEKNFKNGYIPGDDSPVNGFNKWLQEIGIFKYYNEYFTNRFLAKSAITTLYKKFVIDATYSDMMFLSAMLEVIHNDHAMNEWNLEEDFSVVRKGKSKVKIYDSIFESLPLDKSNELKSFYSR